MSFPSTELETFEWRISGLMLDPLFFLISRLNNVCSPLIIILFVFITENKFFSFHFKTNKDFFWIFV